MFKMVGFVILILVVWLMISAPDTSGPIVGEVLKTTGTFAKEVLTALVNWVSNVSDVVSSQTNGAGTTVTVIPAP